MAVEKTHETLHKHIKAFQGALQQPVNALLTDTQTEWKAGGDGGETSVVSIDVQQFITTETLVPNAQVRF